MSYIAVHHKTAIRKTGLVAAVAVVLAVAMVGNGWVNTAIAESKSSKMSPWSKEREKELARYSETVENFRQTAIGRQFFELSYAYAVFPMIAKVGFGIGGAHGKGVVYRGGEIVGKVSVSQLSLGLQAGGQAYSQIVFMQDKRAFDEFTSGNFEVEAGLSATAVNARAGVQVGTSGASASGGLHPAETEQAKTKFYKGVAALTAGKAGLMYEASIAGQKYEFEPY